MSKIIITGASSGIGRSLSLLLSSKHELILVSRRNPLIENSDWIQCDFNNQKDLINLVSILQSKVSKLDMLVNSAGVMNSCSSNSIDLESCIESYMVNTIAPLFITSALTKQISRGKGIAIAISSIASKLDIPGEAIYSSSKAALDKGFETLSADLSRMGGSFIKIHPSLIDTPMTQLLTEDQRNYMNSKKSTKKQPSSDELALYISSLLDNKEWITGSSIYFGGIKR